MFVYRVADGELQEFLIAVKNARNPLEYRVQALKRIMALKEMAVRAWLAHDRIEPDEVWIREYLGRAYATS